MMGLVKLVRYRFVADRLAKSSTLIRKMLPNSSDLKNFAQNGRKIIGAAVNYV